MSERIASLHVTEPAAVGAEGAGDIGGPPAPPPDALTKEQFSEFLGSCFGAAAIGAATVTRNAGWNALAIADGERAQFGQFTNSLHHLAVKYPQYFGWMIRPENETIQAAVIIVTFSVGKARIVGAAVAAQKAQKPAPKSTPAEEAARMQ